MSRVCSDGTRVERPGSRKLVVVVVEVVVVSDAPLLVTVEARHAAYNCTSLRSVDFCQSLGCIENGRVFLSIQSEEKGSPRHLDSRGCDVATHHNSVYHWSYIFFIFNSNLIHWCTISTPHPQWSSGYDFRVSIYRNPLTIRQSTNNLSSCHMILHHDKSRETRVRFPVEEQLRNDSSSNSKSSGAG
jgi:hypothetical protein